MSRRAEKMLANNAAGEEAASARVYDRVMMKRLWKYIRPYSKLLIVALATLPLVALLGLMQPYLFKIVIDDYIMPGRSDGLFVFGVVFLLVLLGEYGARYIHMVVLQLLGQRAMNHLRRDLYSHMFSLRSAYFDRQPVGRLMTRLTSDVESINEAFAAGLVTLIGDILMIVGIVVAMSLLDVELTLVSLAVTPALVIVAILFRRLLRRTYRSIRLRIARINGFLQEHVTGMKVVQLCVQEERAAAEFDTLNREHRDANLAALALDATLYALVETLGSFAIAAVLWWGSGEIARGALTFGVLAAFIEYLARFFTPIRDLSTKFAVMQQAMAGAERIFELFGVEETDATTDGKLAVGLSSPAEPAARSQMAISIRNLTFSYRPEETILHDISLSVQEGETVALVGATGAGKTTLIRLLTRLYEPSSGEIRVGGVDLSTLDRSEIRGRFVVVPQEVFLFSGSVRDNISLWDRTLTNERVRDEANRVGLMGALERRGRTLDSPVGERGGNLSAGEKQLVAFARALVRDPQVLVLDEATANVDPETERLIERGTAELLRDRTSILIAHRLSTIERAQRIVVLHKGRIVESGSHDDLLAGGGVYAKLYRLQYVAAPSVQAAGA